MATRSTPVEVTIIGAGVIGLTIAYLLTDNESKDFKITIVARDMPEDQTSQAFASPWAGANWSPMNYDERLYGWEKKAFDKFWTMIPTGLVLKEPGKIYFEAETADADIWWKSIVRDFRVLEPEELKGRPSYCKSGVSYNTIAVNPAIYLPWLKSQLEERGVRFVRDRVVSLDQVAAMTPEGGIIVNATGLGARSLIGVEDTKAYPIRGQTIVMIAPGATETVGHVPLQHGHDGEATYVIPRPSPPGMVLVGGTFQPNNWNTSVDMATAEGIFNRAKALVPALEAPEARILAHNVGLRPAREGGPRVEAEVVEFPMKGLLRPKPDGLRDMAEKKLAVVHAYGFGPAGYQQSWGGAEEAVRLVKESLGMNA